MVIRYGIANVEPAVVASAGQAANLSGSVSSGFGFGDWGVEATTFVEFAGVSEGTTDTFVRGLLTAHGEQAAYKVVNGSDASLVWANGTETALV